MYCDYQNIVMDAVLCHMPVGNDTVCAWHVCCGCQCSNIKSEPQLMSYTHDIILVHIKCILACTCLYYNTFPVTVRTSTYQYVPVCTKISIPGQQVTIPDV